jgi:hypothetical protein
MGELGLSRVRAPARFTWGCFLRYSRGGAALVGTYPNRATEVTSVINSIALGVSPGSIVNNSIIYLSGCVLDKRLRYL